MAEHVIEREVRVRGDLKIVFALVDDVFDFIEDDIFGEVVDYNQRGALLRDRSPYGPRSDGYMYEGFYVPRMSLEEWVQDFVKRGESRGAAYIRASEQVKIELEQYEDMRGEYCEDRWYMAGLIVSVCWKGIEIARDSVWGIELSTFSSLHDNNATIREISLDVLRGAMNEAREYAESTFNEVAAFRLASVDEALDRLARRKYKESRLNEFLRRIRAWRKGMISPEYLKIGDNNDQ